MWIFCCGAKGTGSTVKFDLVSEVVERYQIGKIVEEVPSKDFSIVRRKYMDYSGFKVFKTHQLTPEIETEFLNNNAIGFYSYRDLRDVLISMSNESDKPITHYVNDRRYVDELISHSLDWQRVPNVHRSAYEDFVADTDSEIRRIKNILNVESPSDEVVSEISQKYSASKSNRAESKKQWSTVFNQEQNKVVEKNAGEWLLNHGYELTTNVSDLKLFSYSQHGEDDYIWKHFDKKRDGLIVEVGAFDGIHLSNSYSLENIGWRSLCMEPTPAMYKKLAINRPKSECFNLAAVGDESVSQIDFLSEELGLLSGVNIDVEDVRLRYERRGLAFKEPKKIKVNARTLNSIFRELELSPGEIDCITIDVEGFEMDVLRGFELKTFQPQMIIIEANTPEQEKEITEFIEQNNYFLLTKLGVNLIFIPNREESKKVIIDCIPMIQIHPLGKEFTIQATTASQASSQKNSTIRRIVRKIQKKFKR